MRRMATKDTDPPADPPAETLDELNRRIAEEAGKATEAPPVKE